MLMFITCLLCNFVKTKVILGKLIITALVFCVFADAAVKQVENHGSTLGFLKTVAELSSYPDCFVILTCK